MSNNPLEENLDKNLPRVPCIIPKQYKTEFLTKTMVTVDAFFCCVICFVFKMIKITYGITSHCKSYLTLIPYIVCDGTATKRKIIHKLKALHKNTLNH